LKDLVGKKFPQKKVELDDTAIVVSVNHRNQPDLTLSCDKSDVDWPAVEKQLLGWGDLFRTGKKLTLNMSFNYTEGSHTQSSGSRSTDKRGTSSATQHMLRDRKQKLMLKNRSLGALLSGIMFTV
jgi:hypothetical protein